MDRGAWQATNQNVESDTTERLTHFQPSQGQAAVCNQNIRRQDPGQSGGRSLQKKPLHSA